MNEKKRYFTIQELASHVGVSTSSLRAWERRHGLFRPDRTPAGHRLYTSDDLKLFWYVTHLREEGAELKHISELGRDELLVQAVRHFSGQEIEGGEERDLSLEGGRANEVPHAGSHATLQVKLPSSPHAVGRLQRRASLLSRAQIGRRTYELILDALERHDFGSALEGLEKLFTVSEDNLEFADTCVELMVRVGDAWHAGRISVAAEHVLTSRVKHLLLGLLYLRGVGTADRGEKENEDAPLALCSTLPGELHELGLLRVAVYLRSWGYRVDYLGTDTPMEALQGHVVRTRPTLVVISTTIAMVPDTLYATLRTLAVEVAAHAPVFVGGSGIFDTAAGPPPVIAPLVFCPTLKEFEVLAKRLLNDAFATK